MKNDGSYATVYKEKVDLQFLSLAFWKPLTEVILSITKFSIMIGSPLVLSFYLSRRRGRNYSCNYSLNIMADKLILNFGAKF